MDIFIIEDEEPAYKNLTKLLKKYDNTVHVVGWVTTVKSSIEWLSGNSSPDLLFVDIHLPDGSAFEIFNNIEINVPVIFTTAYDEYAIKAFEVNSVDYLLKPIRKERLSKSIDKFRKTSSKNLEINLIRGLQQKIHQLSSDRAAFKQRFLIKTGDKFTYIETKDIAYFIADGNIVIAVNKENKKSIVSHTLDDLEKILNPDEFFRATRKYLLHISSIKKVSKYFNSRLKVNINPAPENDEILVSRVKSSLFFNWIEGKTI